MTIDKAGGLNADGIAARVAIVIVTRNRPDFLHGLLESIVKLTTRPGFVIIVDNASEPDTCSVVEEFMQRCSVKMKVSYHRQDNNLGGAGGFNVGVAFALQQDADWFWLMDDDIEVLPDGLTQLIGWTDRFDCFHGQRYDSDGSPFFSSQRISRRFAVQVPMLPDPCKDGHYFLTNWACFEGLFIHRRIVEKIGLPDPRFFIVWDDAMYGFRAAQITEVAFVDNFVIKRARRQPQISLGIRRLNGASDLTRFYMMRNRALVEVYFRHYGCFHPVWFRVGTALVLAKELFRLAAVERSFRGVGALSRGLMAARELRRVKGLTLMPAINGGKVS
jgi:rhamnopyranosyl-N-acetylglucosaminyl-diphospho-decaprenol beta-1,3/1,4-galactofuranosyltransferase